jgi:hydroxypyruvate reductase
LNEAGIREDLTAIFEAALQSVDPCRIVKERLTLTGKKLTVESGTGPKTFDLERFDRVLVAGAGKASMKMAKALEEVLGDRIESGCVSVKVDPGAPLRRIRTTRAGHPVPNESSVQAADEIMRMARNLTKEDLARTLLIVLLSGGGSSLLVSPLRWNLRAADPSGAGARSLSLSDIQRTTDALLACGAPIHAMNCVRKHLSNITGGRLARLFYPAETLVLILSDVVGDRLDTIASGPTAPDDTTYADALEVIRRYGIGEKIPSRVIEALRAGKEGLIEETPKKDDAVFRRVHNVLIGSNRIALAAAAERAAGLGYHPLVLSSRITGEAREAAKVLYGVAREVRERGLEARRKGPAPRLVSLPACIIAGGETTVTLRGNGKGGRNQELALSFLSEMEKNEGGGEGIFLLSASTDGSDGPTDAAGAFASPEALEESRRLALTPGDYLMNNDSYTFFEKAGFLYKTGPTGTNVCDLQIMLIR